MDVTFQNRDLLLEPFLLILLLDMLLYLLEQHTSRKLPEDAKNSHTSTGQKCTGKTKKSRTRFTRKQRIYLEDVFSRQKYLTRDERALLASVLFLTQLQIRNWFQNRRYQLKHQRLLKTVCQVSP